VVPANTLAIQVPLCSGVSDSCWLWKLGGPEGLFAVLASTNIVTEQGHTSFDVNGVILLDLFWAELLGCTYAPGCEFVVLALVKLAS
jgi:hypothetical protein